MAEEVPPEQIRVSDVERKAVQDRLQTAHDEGLITLNEFDERVAAVWQAVNRGDLAVLTADLPASLPVRPAPAPAPVRRPAAKPVRRRKSNTALRVLNIIWLSIMAVNLVVWGLVCITNWELIYAWWVWLFVPGAALGVLWVTVGGGRPELPRGEAGTE
ncbi:MAG TPA: DUF1707 domain-containing protein [Pseudonocardiaceae bacterium]|nr:DUF1707 domain-containing protein [Pseudonocardiaceae bacterium]